MIIRQPMEQSLPNRGFPSMMSDIQLSTAKSQCVPDSLLCNNVVLTCCPPLYLYSWCLCCLSTAS